MKGSILVFLSIGFIFILIGSNSCRHELPYPGNGANDSTIQSNNCNSDTVYFTNEILPLINSNCATSGCHDAGTRAEGVELTSYSKIRNYVKPYNAAGSKLYEVVIKTGNDRMPPPPMPAFTAEQKSKLQKWINQGALNNQCNSGCDSALFTYSGAISPLMNTYCKGCHNPTSLGGGIDLSTYTTVKAQALNGKLVGSIAHTPGFFPMPKGGSKFSDCQIKQVQKWIGAGTLNN